MFKFKSLFLIILFINISSAQELKKEYQVLVNNFVQSLKDNDISQLNSLIKYPLKRQYPLSDIRNKRDFKDRYTEIFDDSLSTIIINSNISKDWSAVGWRGIMLDRGIVWLDVKGNVLAINYESKNEKKKRNKLIEKDRKSIHKSIRGFEEPKLQLETETTRVRIDIMANGLYRIISWPINSSMREKPELIIENGTWMPEGSSGNNKYEFIKGDLKYLCYINHMRSEDTPPAEVVGYKNEKIIFSQSAKIIRN